MKEEAREYYHFLLTVCRDENIPLVTAYRQLREFLERFCRTQMPDGSLPTAFQCRTESAIRTFTRESIA